MINTLTITDFTSEVAAVVVGVPKWDAATSTYTFTVYTADPVLTAARCADLDGVKSAKIGFKSKHVHVTMEAVDFVTNRQALRDALGGNLPAPIGAKSGETHLPPLEREITPNPAIAYVDMGFAQKTRKSRVKRLSVDFCRPLTADFDDCADWLSPSAFFAAQVDGWMRDIQAGVTEWMLTQPDTEPDTAAIDDAAIERDNMTLLLTAPTTPQPKLQVGSVVYRGSTEVYCRVLAFGYANSGQIAFVWMLNDVHIMPTAYLEGEIYLGDMTVTHATLSLNANQQAALDAAQADPEGYSAARRARQFGGGKKAYTQIVTTPGMVVL